MRGSRPPRVGDPALTPRLSIWTEVEDWPRVVRVSGVQGPQGWFHVLLTGRLRYVWISHEADETGHYWSAER